MRLVRILLVSQMYPGPHDPDLGVFVRDLESALAAYAAGFEMTAGVARGSHPELYERGFHPTAVCGTAGAALASARILDLDERRTDNAIALSLLRAGGLRAAFGSQGNALGCLIFPNIPDFALDRGGSVSL